MSDWESSKSITKAEFYALDAQSRRRIEFQPNKWQWDWDTESYVNADHPENEEWRLMREAAEARALIG